MSELFRGYLSLGAHEASEGLPTVPRLKQGLIDFYQPGGTNIYFEECGTRPIKKLDAIKQILANQYPQERSVFAAVMDASAISDRSRQFLRDALVKYKLDLVRYGHARTRNSMTLHHPDLEQYLLFSAAEYEMLDELPKDLNLVFTSEALSEKDLTKSNALMEKSQRLNSDMAGCLMDGKIIQAVDLGRAAMVILGEGIRFRNSRVADTWNILREQAIKDSRPTRLGSRFGLAHFSLRDRLVADEWIFDYAFNPLTLPFFRLAAACEVDPKKRPEDEEVFELLLDTITRIRFPNLPLEQVARFVQELLPRTTSKEIKEMAKKQANLGLEVIFDAFIRERNLVSPI